MYYICYPHPEKGNIYDTAPDEDAMRQHVYAITTRLDLEENDVHMFRAKDEI